MNKQEIINLVNDAIVASSKKFKEIKKESFFSFFQERGLDKNQWESLYNELCEIHDPKPKKKSNRDDSQNHFKENIDYYSSTHNDVKKREPRKSIFGKIVKIAG